MRTPEEVMAQYQSRGIGKRIGFGQRPAVIVVDFTQGFTDPASPLGGDFTAELAATRQLLAVARQKGLPVCFTTVAYAPNLCDAGIWIEKIPASKALIEGSPLVEVNPSLAFDPQRESLLVKKFASAFFGTDLVTRLLSRGIDTVLLAGCTTSGCIRATAVDACQYGFRTIVVREAVGDRAQEPHLANLFDIDAKYGDVVSLSQALSFLDALSAIDDTAPSAPGTEA